jgi:hypothetical protein
VDKDISIGGLSLMNNFDYTDVHPFVNQGDGVFSGYGETDAVTG